ncbi:MAG: hypothetical protein ACK56F_10465 [bacterium]
MRRGELLLSVAAELAVAEVVREDEDNVGRLLRRNVTTGLLLRGDRTRPCECRRKGSADDAQGTNEMAEKRRHARSMTAFALLGDLDRAAEHESAAHSDATFIDDSDA